MTNHAYIEGGQLWVVEGALDHVPYFLKGRTVYKNDGIEPTQVWSPSEDSDFSVSLTASSLSGLADKLGATLHDSEAAAVAAFEAAGPSLDWQDVAERLFGPDWIAPLSEVLGINRRTVERWRSGAVAIPERVAADIADLARRGRDNRNYGVMLRRAASGEDPVTIRDAAEALVLDIEDEVPVAMKAARRI